MKTVSPLCPELPQLRRDAHSAEFRDQIRLLDHSYKIANEYLDFDRFPVSSTTEWSNRLEVNFEYI